MEIRTTCPYCGVGCGVVASVDDDGQVSVRGMSSTRQTLAACA
jgi:assimilatory nitrate reductase catalytic subunit